MKEKRVAARKRSRHLVRFRRAASFTIDVSGEGFCLGALQILPVNSSVEGTIQLDGSQVPFSGRVAWISPGDRRINLSGKMGVSFTRSIPEVARLIESAGSSTRRAG